MEACVPQASEAGLRKCQQLYASTTYGNNEDANAHICMPKCGATNNK